MNTQSSGDKLLFYGFSPAQIAAVREAYGTDFQVVLADSPAVMLPYAAVFIHATCSTADTGILKPLPWRKPDSPTVVCSESDAGLLRASIESGICCIFGITETIAARIVPYTRALLMPIGAWGPRMLLSNSARFHNVPYDPVLNRDLQMEGVLGFFAVAGLPKESVDDLRLALNELLNNAVYHGLQHGGPQTPTGEDMDASGRVRIEFGLDDDHALMSVTDNVGALHPARINEVLLRHQNAEGLFDLRGRGLYLVRNLTDELYFHLQPGRRTQVTFIFGRHRNPIVKSLQVRVYPSG